MLPTHLLSGVSLASVRIRPIRMHGSRALRGSLQQMINTDSAGRHRGSVLAAVRNAEGTPAPG